MNIVVKTVRGETMYISVPLRIKPLTSYEWSSSVRSEIFPHERSFNVCYSVPANTSEYV